MGQNIGTYAQLRICIGQFCRFGVSAGLCTEEKICNKVCAFALISSMDAWKSFLFKFQIRGASGALSCKAGYLICLARYADSYFASLGMYRDLCELAAVSEYLHCVQSTAKNVSRKRLKHAAQLQRGIWPAILYTRRISRNGGAQLWIYAAAWLKRGEASFPVKALARLERTWKVRII